MISTRKDNAVDFTCDTLPADLSKANYFRKINGYIEFVADNNDNTEYSPVGQGAQLFCINTSKNYMYEINTNPGAVKGQTGLWVEVNYMEGGIQW